MIVSIGEMLIDLMQENDGYIPYPGGAPANVAIHANRCGSNARFIGKLSNDRFGSLLEATLVKHRVYFDLPKSSKPTALALVSHHRGERSFQFYRTDTADLYLDIADINRIPFNPSTILHFCSLGLVPDKTTQEAHLYAINQCKKNHGIVSFDINLRPLLWDSLDEAKSIIMQCIDKVDIVKVNEEEMLWLSGSSDIENGLYKLQTHEQLVICTCGDKGSVALNSSGQIIKVPAYKTSQVDTTGAGDCYIGCVLASLDQSELNFEAWQTSLLSNAMTKASRISAQVVAQKGATPEVDYEAVY